MTPAFLSGLNEQQLEAVTLPHQSALILAGAGSGKTRVLTTRMAWLIQTGQISPMSLLAVTFTNKAAKEMMTRLSAMLPINTRGMWVGTFHGLCNRMLRAHYREAALPQMFQILDTQDQLALVKRLMRALNIDEERYPPRQAQWFIAAQKEEGKRADKVEPYDDFSRRMVEFYAEYDRQCQREGVVDFAELLLRSYELLARNESLREHYAGRFRHVLVDEFQDTNRLQYRWLQLLAGRHNAIFAVGDDDQSIYGWRGASTANMQDLQRDFHVEKVIKLEQNYRSHGNILDAANALIGHNRKRLGKNLWTADDKGEPLRVYEAATDFAEASYVVDEVRTLRSEGARLAEIAVLYRSNAQSRVIEHALFTAGMPYRVYGGLRFFERQEIKHALSYLRLVANQEDDGALLRIINFPTRGIGNRSLEQLQGMAKESGMSLWAAACANTLSGRAAASIAAFVRLIEAMRSATAGLPLPEVIGHVVEHSGLKAHYRNEKEGADRIENLDELVNAAAVFVDERATWAPAEGTPPEAINDAGEEAPPEGMNDAGVNASPGGMNDAGVNASPGEMDDLTAFLAHAALEAGEHQALAGADALQLMTVHSAKGLEFLAVFVTGLEEGLFPHENSMTEADGVEEERRLMYVALTRARRRLYLLLAQSRMLHGQTRYNVPSRFFQELPEALLQRVNHVRQAPVSAYAYQGQPVYGSGTHAGSRGAAIAPALPSRDSPWRIGQAVTHAKFGAGVIVNAEGGGAEARVQVNFRDAGLKWLMLEYAKLTSA
ncbi:MAG: UvrD-helicase domain-containing protein [Burkholderiales bacterium]|nr:UvrD-helicase domain-containing protein [Burkholderiales bacterium]